MSDESETDTPYTPPAPSDEPLAKQATEANEVKLHPVHFATPLAGYACFPLFIGLTFSGPYINAILWLPLQAFSFLILLMVPFFAGFIFWLTLQRIRARNYGVALILFQVLSIAPPLLLSLKGISIMPILV